MDAVSEHELDLWATDPPAARMALLLAGWRLVERTLPSDENCWQALWLPPAEQSRREVTGTSFMRAWHFLVLGREYEGWQSYYLENRDITIAQSRVLETERWRAEGSLSELPMKAISNIHIREWITYVREGLIVREEW